MPNLHRIHRRADERYRQIANWKTLETVGDHLVCRRRNSAKTESPRYRSIGIQARGAEHGDNLAGYIGGTGEQLVDREKVTADVIQMELYRPLAGRIGCDVLRHGEWRGDEPGNERRRQAVI